MMQVDLEKPDNDVARSIAAQCGMNAETFASFRIVRAPMPFLIIGFANCAEAKQAAQRIEGYTWGNQVIANIERAFPRTRDVSH